VPIAAAENGHHRVVDRVAARDGWSSKLRVVLALAAFVSITACSGAGDQSSAETEPYALLEADGWQVRGSGRPGASGDATVGAEPGMTWYVGYERLVPAAAGTEGQDLRLSGHEVPIEEHVRQLRYPFDRTMIDGRSAATHHGSDGPSMVVIAVEEERTVLLLSYALTVPDLRRLAETETRFVNEAAWLDAVG
jgi:hypothetical protein